MLTSFLPGDRPWQENIDMAKFKEALGRSHGVENSMLHLEPIAVSTV